MLLKPVIDPAGEHRLAGGWLRFSVFEDMEGKPHPAADVPAETLHAFTRPRAPICGFDGTRPVVMGILNLTPDSFSDGGRLTDFAKVQAAAHPSADLLDIGGESTRPGAEEVSIDEEIARTAPVIKALREAGETRPISIDTRKAAVAEAAFEAGADLFNDVSAFTFDPASPAVAAKFDVPVCLMHAQGLPETMQNNPRYGDVLSEVYTALQNAVKAAEAAGIAREKIIVDPGIGFGKTLEHNLILLRNLSVFHGLGCMILLGASRKRFIEAATGATDPMQRLGGSLAAALRGADQGVQFIRAHDMAETKQALQIDSAIHGYE
ncbi:dihydropteroate synthase [Paracoccaceae bacterium GXU_MW_L88]